MECETQARAQISCEWKWKQAQENMDLGFPVWVIFLISQFFRVTCFVSIPVDIPYRCLLLSFALWRGFCVYGVLIFCLMEEYCNKEFDRKILWETILVELYFWIYRHKFSNTVNFLQPLCWVHSYPKIRKKLYSETGLFPHWKGSSVRVLKQEEVDIWVRSPVLLGTSVIHLTYLKNVKNTNSNKNGKCLRPQRARFSEVVLFYEKYHRCGQ